MKTVLRMLCVGVSVMASGCSAKYARLSDPDAEFRAADRKTQETCTRDEQAARNGLEAVQALFADYRPANVAAHVRRVYAETVYFRDGFKKLRDLDAIEAYMLHGAEPLRTCVFEFEEAVTDGNGNWYLKWIMKVSLKSDPPDHLDQAIGISHLRFNDEGQVIFQQDYWDPTDVLYRRIPVANWLIGVARKRL